MKLTMNTSIAILFSIALATILSPNCNAFSPQLIAAKIGQCSQTSSSCLFTTSDDDNISANDSAMNDDEEENLDDMPVIAQSTVKIDDGGSDLTDRFKYKVGNILQ